MKKQILIIILLLLNSLIVFIPIDTVKGDPNPNGGNVVGDTVYWENSYANLSVYPHTSNNIIRQTQYANLTWKETDNSIDVAFRFDEALSYGRIWILVDESWNQVTMDHTTYNSKHYYYYAGFNVVKDTTYRFKWEYDVIANTSGKWDLFAKLNQHTVQQALDNNWYVALDPWWDATWNYYKKITIESDYIDADLTNFPVQVNSTDAVMINKCQANGEDIRFVSTDNTTEFYYEIEEWNSVGFTVWVNISEVVTSATDYSFLMYYGNGGVSDNQDSGNVWDNNYLGVYHLNESSGTTCYDSTANNNDGTYHGNLPTQIFGKAGYGQMFDGSDDNISLPSGCFISTVGTVSIWSKANVTGINYRFYTQAGNKDPNATYDQFFLSYWDSAGYNNGAIQWSLAHGLASDTSWNCTAVSMATNDIDYFSRGVTKSDNTATLGEDVYRYIYIGENNDGNYDMYGTLDEARVSNIKRNSSWLDASFNSTNMTTGFMTWDVEQYRIWKNSNPINSNTNPANEGRATNLTPTLSITITDLDMGNQSVNTTWTSNSSGSWISFATNSSATNTTFYQTFTNGTTYGTTYWWNISTNDGNDGWDNDTYSFTINNPPVFTNVIPVNLSDSDVGVDLSITITDPDGDTFNWTIGTYPDIGDSSGNDETDGVKTCSITPSHNTNYTWYVNCTDSYDWINTSYNFTAMIQYVAVPTNGTVVYYTDINYLNISWDNNSGSSETYRTDNYVVVQRNDTYATSATQSGNWVRQNITRSWFNISWVETGSTYYSIFGYNNSAYMYSYNNATPEGLDIPWGALVINCYDEETNVSLWFDVFISNQDGSSTYESLNNTNPHFLDISQLPVGDDIKIVVSAASNYSEKSDISYWGVDENYTITYIVLSQTADSKSTTNVTCINESNDHHSYPPFTLDGDLVTILPDNADDFTKVFVNYTHKEYSSRLYYQDIEVSSFSILNTYLPPTENKQLYLLEVIDESDSTVQDAHIEVKRSVNGTYVIVSRLLTDANGQADINLISDRDYIFIISKDGYVTENASWTPGTSIFTHTFKITWEMIPSEPDTFGDIINLYGTLYENNTIRVIYYDLDVATLNTHFTVYEDYDGVLTYMGEYNGTTGNDITFWINVSNATRLHIVVLFMNHSTLREVVNYRIFVYPVHVDRVGGTWLEDLIASVVGEWAYGYVITLLWVFPCIILIAGMGAIGQPGIGGIAAGLYSFWLTWNITLPEEARILTFASIAIVVGFITVVLVKGKKVIH